MGFEVIPAVDVSGGLTARMARGDPDSVRDLGQDPVEVARGYAAAGARWIHVVDLDAAIRGRPRNLAVLARIVELPVRVQAGGSLTAEAAMEALGRGAARAVLGSAIIRDPAALAAALRRSRHRLGVALDVREGSMAPRGSRTIGPSLEEALRVVAAAGPPFLTYTDVARDGAPAGPDLEALATVAERTGAPVIASGGVRSLDDLRALAAATPPLAGVIVGRALQEGWFTLPDALAAVGEIRR